MEVMLTRLTALVLVVPYQFFLFVDATKVKWTAASDNSNDPAATAPRSQKYWDTHGIKRPDYAKTDAELALERGDPITSFSMIWVLLVVAAVSWVVYQQYQKRSGERLDGSSGLFKRHLTPEEARNARLARFDEAMKAD
jgi:hypothetical protein